MLPTDGFDWRKPTHIILLEEEQSSAEALRVYMDKYPGKVVAPDHNVFWIALASPKFNPDGSRIFLKPEETSHKRGTSLAEALHELGEEQ
jgi:hypothetical protein